jgi:hypothetical protein
MSRDWHAVYAAVLDTPKYRLLSIDGKAALAHVWMSAGRRSPEATWPSTDALAEALDLDGFPGAVVVAELVQRRWLDCDRQGRVLVHDWDAHQMAATASVKRTYEADRKAEWRRKATRN